MKYSELHFYAFLFPRACYMSLYPIIFHNHPEDNKQIVRILKFLVMFFSDSLLSYPCRKRCKAQKNCAKAEEFSNSSGDEKRRSIDLYCSVTVMLCCS